MLETILLESRCVPAVRIQLDYSMDVSNYFADPTRRALLEQAATIASERLSDSLVAITPGGTNTFTINVENPSNGQTVSIPNFVVPTDTLVLFVGGRSLEGTELAEAVMGTSTATGSPEWVQFATTRGRNVVPTVWGASITFDDRPSSNYYYGIDESGIGADQRDFLTVATHEIFHALGVGISEPWTRKIVDGKFTGAASMQVYGSPVPTSRDRAHWDPRISYNDQSTLLDPIVERGKRLLPTDLDYAVLRDIGWSLAAPSIDRLNQPLGDGPKFFAVGADEGFDPVVGIFSPETGAKTNEFIVAPVSFRGGVRVATADVDGDGFDDLVTAYGPGGSPVIRAISGKNGAQMMTFAAFEATYTGGVLVTTADLNGDERAEVIATADEGGGPRVRVFDGASGRVLADFLGIEDSNFRGGARAAVGDLNGDGVADLLVGAGVGGGPRLAAFDGRALATGQVRKLFDDFFVFEPTLRNGVYATIADINDDGFGEVLVGGGPGGGPRVFAVDGKDLLAGIKTQRANFFAGSSQSRNGVRLAMKDLNADGRSELLAATGPNVTAYDLNNLPRDGSPAQKLQLQPFGPEMSTGLFVG